MSDPGNVGSSSRPPHGQGTEGDLTLSHLTKHYGSTRVLSDIDLTIARGSFVTILGPSGSGKTTLLRLLAGYLPVESGEIHLGSEDISGWSPAKRGIGMVFQNYALFPHMSAARNIEYPLRVRRWPRPKRATRVREMLQLVDLESHANSMPRAMSGGQQQRVALGRALAFDPALLLMDEPLGALDKELRLRMVVELRRIHRQVGSTFLYVTHDREEALSLSDRIVILRDGSVVADGSPQELFARPRSEFVASFFGGHNIVPCSVTRESNGSMRSVHCLDSAVSVFAHETADLDRQSAVCLPGDAMSLEPARGQEEFVAAIVRSATYMGGRVEAVCAVPAADGRPEVELRVDVRGGEERPPAPGTAVRLYIDWSRATLISGTDDTTTP